MTNSSNDTSMWFLNKIDRNYSSLSVKTQQNLVTGLNLNLITYSLYHTSININSIAIMFEEDELFYVSPAQNYSELKKTFNFSQGCASQRIVAPKCFDYYEVIKSKYYGTVNSETSTKGEFNHSNYFTVPSLNMDMETNQINFNFLLCAGFGGREKTLKAIYCIEYQLMGNAYSDN